MEYGTVEYYKSKFAESETYTDRRIDFVGTMISVLTRDWESDEQTLIHARNIVKAYEETKKAPQPF